MKRPAIAPAGLARPQGTAFGCPRDFLDQRFIYTVISPRARGLSIGVNMNPDRHCNFDCVYCEVDRATPPIHPTLDVPDMICELERTLALVSSGGLRKRPCYLAAPPELLELRHVALSGDGEPTFCPAFVDAVAAIVHLRARGRVPFFKLVLITNATGLHLPEVREGLGMFSPHDEVWAKLEAGTQEHMDRVNRPQCALSTVLENILQLARKRPVVIQSLFPMIHGASPTDGEIDAYVARLGELKEAGARISLVQIVSATRPVARQECGHLPLRELSLIAAKVRRATGLAAEVF